MSDLAVFGYASLVSPASAAATLGREVEIAAPARLPGRRRRWSLARDNLASEKTFARQGDRSLPAFCLGLNLEPAGPGEPAPNGVLIEVVEAELERLDRREVRYERIEVTDVIDTQGGDRPARVFTYVAKRSHFASTPPVDAVVLGSYVRAVEDAFAALGADQLELFTNTTDHPPVEVVEGVLVRDGIPAGNPREW